MPFLGIDVGTGGTRCVLLDQRGKLLSSASAPHPPIRMPQIGWAEQDPRDWWRAACDAIKQCMARAGTEPEQIGAIGLTGQMHGLVILDSRGDPLRPAILWCDQRTEEQCRAITERVGAQNLIELAANPAITGFTLPKIWWIQEHEPEHWVRVRSVLLPKDYVRFRLTDIHATDVADASGTLLFDVANRCWSSRMLEISRLKAEQLPRVFESQEIAGTVSEQGARATGLCPGTPVVAGAGDQAAGAVGMGIVSAGDISATIGTSGVVFAATSGSVIDPRGRIHTFCHAIPRRWHVMGVTQGAGLSLRWFRDQFGPGTDDGRDPYDRLLEEAASSTPGAGGLLWIPYLMGERTPHLDPHARGALLGLTARHTRADVIRAILEGVAFSLRDTLTVFQELNIPMRNIRLGGGGARSPLWQQIQADVYDMPVELVEAEQGPAYGAALLAEVGIGEWPSVEKACESAVHVAGRLEPNPKTASLMGRQYAEYRKAYPAIRQIAHTFD